MDKKLQVNKTARYSTFGDAKTARTVWIVLHGYGQLTPYFIRKFQSLSEKDHFIIAPEGLHRFYLNGTSGRVGASWMTKEERESDILDNITYLETVYKSLILPHSFEHKVLLGFSQGGATACRWHEKGSYQADQFILWASVFPPDLTITENVSAFNNSKNQFVIGTKDEYYSEINRNKLIEKLNELNLPFETIVYDGTHNIEPSVLLQIANTQRNM